jgi:hypothetical protein
LGFRLEILRSLLPERLRLPVKHRRVQRHRARGRRRRFGAAVRQRNRRLRGGLALLREIPGRAEEHLRDAEVRYRSIACAVVADGVRVRLEGAGGRRNVHSRRVHLRGGELRQALEFRILRRLRQRVQSSPGRERHQRGRQARELRNLREQAFPRRVPGLAKLLVLDLPRGESAELVCKGQYDCGLGSGKSD